MAMEDDWFFDKDGEVEVSVGGNLPHWHQEGKLQFVTFHLADSLPQSVIEEKKRLKASFLELNPEPWSPSVARRYSYLIGERTERLLDGEHGSCVLRQKEVRDVVASALRFLDSKRYDLIAYVIMPNHVHAIFCPYGGESTARILHSIKSFSAHKINSMLNLSGELWEREAFDRLIRNEHDLKLKMAYIRDNPRNLTSDQFELYLKE